MLKVRKEIENGLWRLDRYCRRLCRAGHLSILQLERGEVRTVHTHYVGKEGGSFDWGRFSVVPTQGKSRGASDPGTFHAWPCGYGAPIVERKGPDRQGSPTKAGVDGGEWSDHVKSRMQERCVLIISKKDVH